MLYCIVLYCIVEWYTSPRAEERLSHRARGLLAVLREQSRLIQQRNNDTVTDLDEDRVAWMYQRETEHCLSKASMQGMRDEMEAFRIYNEPEEEVEVEKVVVGHAFLEAKGGGPPTPIGQ
jgi:hypothetical protein